MSLFDSDHRQRVAIVETYSPQQFVIRGQFRFPAIENVIPVEAVSMPQRLPCCIDLVAYFIAAEPRYLVSLCEQGKRFTHYIPDRLIPARPELILYQYLHLTSQNYSHDDLT